jgi:hypothetical protein
MEDEERLYYFSYIAALEKYYCDEIGTEADWDGCSKTLVNDGLSITFEENIRNWEKQKCNCEKLKIKPNKKLGQKLLRLVKNKVNIEVKKRLERIKVLDEEIKNINKDLEK